jgi:hypothetical protein
MYVVNSDVASNLLLSHVLNLQINIYGNVLFFCFFVKRTVYRF